MTNTRIPETTYSFQVEKTERHYLVGHAPAMRSKFRKFPIVPDEIVIYLRNGFISFVSLRGPSILRSGEFGARHTFIADPGEYSESPVPNWVEDLIASEGLQWEPVRSGAR